MKTRALLGLTAVMAVVAVIVWAVNEAADADRPPPTRPPGSSISPEPEPSEARVWVGAGDIAACGRGEDEATARLVEAIGGTVFTTGDNAYENGSARDYRECYDPGWGRFRDRTQPVPGNHEYRTPDAAGYFEYFGSRVGRPGESWYAYELGAWRIYALDSNCDRIGGCGEGSPQLAWLVQDLARHPSRCVAAHWHHPRFSSGLRGDTPMVDPLWRALVDAGAELVVVGHDHLYERFAPLDRDGAVAATGGMRQFTVGTGGKNAYGFRRVSVGSEVRESGMFGIIRFVLRDGGYEWRFLAVGDAAVTDEGSASCH